MAYESAQRITASLPPHLAAFVDEYQQRTGTSKSEIIALGLRALQEQLLAEEYAAYAQSGEFVDLEAGDGLDDEAAQWPKG
ncbi:ribbon-helix-helix domain-containing protein [Deinococcus multiflagellatus]|uniref:CopG family transcriptional regulator n=1 Tax=Deinococcus multiflagellatus TaxID=1656887 RepID=A0ABW1ZKA7_9DEIO|nr:ribbon-helix-helix domain-containing protein [Deinococcus multiflagellatus]MBZ9713387.1 ribbon-helix-helix domain-containing protein [Deinococcus multiflagellatus]